MSCSARRMPELLEVPFTELNSISCIVPEFRYNESCTEGLEGNSDGGNP
jgi:hypothetical protein